MLYRSAFCVLLSDIKKLNPLNFIFMKTKNYFLTLILAFSCSSLFATNYDVSVYTDGAATDAKTLRWAITQANAADANTISFSGTPAEIVLASALPGITKSTTINTGNTMITIKAFAGANVFTTSANKSVTLNYLTIKKCYYKCIKHKQCRWNINL